MAEYICGANVYQNEQSEEWVGEWAEACQNRDSLVLAAKFTMDYRSHAIGKGPRAANFGGVSDAPAWIVAAANMYAIDHIKTPFSIYQGRWNLPNRDFERDTIPMAREFGMALAP
ncbi:unnamed protein product [Penicillium palitans]